MSMSKKILSKHQNKAEFKDLNDSLGLISDFLALEPLKSQWPQQPQWPQRPQWPRQPQFIKTLTDPDGWIIPGTQMTNTSSFLWNGSSKIQFFTDIWSSFCRRLLRPADVIFLKTGWWNTNVQTSVSRYAS